MEQTLTWTQGGEAFSIKDIERFKKEILPTHFNNVKLSSFVQVLKQRLLFKRVDPYRHQHKPAELEFKHEFFKRDNFNKADFLSHNKTTLATIKTSHGKPGDGESMAESAGETADVHLQDTVTAAAATGAEMHVAPAAAQRHGGPTLTDPAASHADVKRPHIDSAEDTAAPQAKRQCVQERETVRAKLRKFKELSEEIDKVVKAKEEHEQVINKLEQTLEVFYQRFYELGKQI